jgi:hypothetical protein
MVIMALSVRVGSSLAMDNAAKALQFQSVAAKLDLIEHQPSKLRGAGSSPAAVASPKSLGSVYEPYEPRPTRDPAGQARQAGSACS